VPTFAYTARDSAGSPLNGTLIADTIDAAVAALRGEGKYPTSVAPAQAAAKPIAIGFGSRLSRKDLIHTATQIQIMLETGVTLSDALDCIAQQSEKPHVKKIMDDIRAQVQGGSTFSAALARHPRSFPRLFISLMAASERSGLMAKLLARAVGYLRDEQEAVRRVRGALTYPAIMLTFAISTTCFLLTFVLPKFTAIFAAKGAALPVPTKILMALSGFLIGQWPWITLGLVSFSIVFWLWSGTVSGRRILHLIQLRVPLFGGLYRKLHLSRGVRMIGTMAGAGVSLVDAVRTARELCGNLYFQDLWDKVMRQIEAGKQFSEPLFDSKLVPRSVSQMLHSAEKGGKLAIVMEQVSGYAETELKEQVAEMTRYIEPLMIAVMGFIIGGISLALMLPIFTISRVVAR
jgi:type IV pilus assembly protein PilC